MTKNREGIRKAVRVVADFRGWYRHYRHDRGGYVFNDHEGFESNPNLFAEDLNLLIPIWEEFELITNFNFDICRNMKSRKFRCKLLNHTGTICYEEFGETIQEAALLATAKCIESLKGEIKDG